MIICAILDIELSFPFDNDGDDALYLDTFFKNKK